MTVPVSSAGAAAGNQSGGQQQGGQQDQQGADGGDGQNGGQQAGSLLDDEAENGGQQEQGGQQQDGGNAGQQQSAGLTEEGIARLIESTFDRRINAVLREVRGTPNGQRQDQQNGGQQVQQQGQPQQQQPQTVVVSGPSAADVREARGVYREYIGDEIRFLGNEERDLAATLAQGMLQQRLAAGDDAEAAGSAVAKDVAKAIKNARRLYEDRTVSALKRKGLLPEDAGRPGQPTPGPNKPGAQSGYVAGAAVAQQMFASRLPQTQQQ